MYRKLMLPMLQTLLQALLQALQMASPMRAMLSLSQRDRER
jgi:hypothetical protein